MKLWAWWLRHYMPWFQLNHASKSYTTGCIQCSHFIVLYCGSVPVDYELFLQGSLTHWGRDKMADISRRHLPMYFLNENTSISINISLKFVPEGRINNIPALVQIMDWRRLGDKPLSEPLMVSLLTHICVTRPQWVKWHRRTQAYNNPRASEAILKDWGELSLRIHW